MKYPNGHDLEPGTRIHCDGAGCTQRAKHCEHMTWSSGPGLSFFNFCPDCWVKPGPYGVSPRDRANGVPATGSKKKAAPRLDGPLTQRDMLALRRVARELEAEATGELVYMLPLRKDEIIAIRKAARRLAEPGRDGGA